MNLVHEKRLYLTGTVVQKSDDNNTMIINSEANTMVEVGSSLGTMIINDTDDDEGGGSDSSTANTMKR